MLRRPAHLFLPLQSEGLESSAGTGGALDSCPSIPASTTTSLTGILLDELPGNIKRAAARKGLSFPPGQEGAPRTTCSVKRLSSQEAVLEGNDWRGRDVCVVDDDFVIKLEHLLKSYIPSVLQSPTVSAVSPVAVAHTVRVYTYVEAHPQVGLD